ncbi:fatty-acid-binding protein 2 isoform X2 [Magnolia sinica]|uniref:fatty-acid-binding protein 2 isoform X2 n=1 Tax=Magnolia sinica TaxID=86752 RepID=UPI002658F761|nr:fatty-acid-binding protein 2 isoform X2 [Magnolia sinica]
MRNSWLFFTNLDLDGGCPYFFPESHLYYGHFYIPGSLALQEAFSCISKFTGALLVWFAGGLNSNLPCKLSGNPHGSKNGNCQSCTQVKHITSSRHNSAGFQLGSRSRVESAAPMFFGKIMSSTIRNLWNEVEQLQSFPMLSLAAALVPPFDNISKVLAVPLVNIDEQISGQMDQLACGDEYKGCSSLSLSEIKWRRDAVEPRTGIKFPSVLGNLVAGDNRSTLTSEVLVGTGSKSMRIIKVKSLKVYAFGVYVHPDSVCERLGPKYATVPITELKNHPDFFEDMLSSFEKSLRARLLKVNPDTDYNCLKAFGSYFTQDIPLPAGTTIDFRRTTKGQLITEIGGRTIGAVDSKDLCRAFFDMYIGDVPVSVPAKQEIATNVAGMMRRCY